MYVCLWKKQCQKTWQHMQTEEQKVQCKKEQDLHKHSKDRNKGRGKKTKEKKFTAKGQTSKVSSEF